MELELTDLTTLAKVMAAVCGLVVLSLLIYCSEEIVKGVLTTVFGSLTILLVLGILLEYFDFGGVFIIGTIIEFLLTSVIAAMFFGFWVGIVWGFYSTARDYWDDFLFRTRYAIENGEEQPRFLDKRTYGWFGMLATVIFILFSIIFSWEFSPSGITIFWIVAYCCFCLFRRYSGWFRRYYERFRR